MSLLVVGSTAFSKDIAKEVGWTMCPHRKMIPVSTRWYSSRRVPAKALAVSGGAALFAAAEDTDCAAELLLFGGTVKRFDCSLVFTTSNGAVTMPPARPPRLHICSVSYIS